MHLELYRLQHDQLRALLAETSQHLVPLDAGACRTSLVRLATVLNVHLALEDRALYPRLVAHDDARIQDIAREFQTRMGNLALDFQAFCERWGRPGAIESDTDEFTLAYCTFSQTLRQRMDKEDMTLYRLVDSV